MKESVKTILTKHNYYLIRTFTINIVGFKNNSTIFVVEL